MITKKESFLGSMFLGAIGDAMGSGYENLKPLDDTIFYPFEKPEKKIPEWRITDDTQLTVITCEALLEDPMLDPKTLSNYFISYFSKGMIKGIGASTLKAFQELQLGSDWSQVGRKGEYAAGNGAAMRISPLAFYDNISRERIEEICSITHQNSEAYVGALAIVLCIQNIRKGNWNDKISLMKLIIPNLPDSRVRDRLLEIDALVSTKSITEIATLGNDGYVVNSIPLSIFAANMIKDNHISFIFDQLIASGGDTDTNCSLTGQICGAYLGINKVPLLFKKKLEKLEEYSWIKQITEKLGKTIES